MAFPGPRSTAGLSVAVSAGTGLVTNLLTGRWSPALAAALAVLVAAGIVLAVRSASGGGRRTRGRMVARGGTIHGSGQTVSGGAQASTTASGGGRIDRSPIVADGAEVAMKASRHGEIVDSPIDATD